MCEFLWSDPEEINDWEANPRGAGVIFGSQLVDKFLSTNNIVFIVYNNKLVKENIQEDLFLEEQVYNPLQKL